MTRLRLIPISLLTGTALLMAQDPQNGGWRRFGDPLPALPLRHPRLLRPPRLPKLSLPSLR